MIVRALLRLLTLAALAWFGWSVARWLKGGGQRRTPDKTPPRAVSGTMVRDRMCNTFLPQERALAARIGDQTHWFCSETCKRRFLDESGLAETG